MKSIGKSLDIMELFSSRDEMSLGEIVRSSGLKKATVHRIISVLVKRGFLKQRMKRGKYSIGSRFLDIGGTISNNYSKNEYNAMSYLSELSRLINESVSIRLWFGSDILFSRSHDYYNEYLKITPQDWVAPLHSMCTGKLILSSMSDKDLNKYFQSKQLQKCTPKTITDIDQLKKHLLTVRREGYAIEDEESTSGLRGIAARIQNGDGETIGAIQILGSSDRLTDVKINKILPSIKICALKFSNYFGFRD